MWTCTAGCHAQQHLPVQTLQIQVALMCKGRLARQCYHRSAVCMAASAACTDVCAGRALLLDTIFSAGLGLDALALRSRALSLGEGGLDQETSNGVGVHVGRRPPVLQVAIVLELHSSSMQVSGAPLRLPVQRVMGRRRYDTGSCCTPHCAESDQVIGA